MGRKTRSRAQYVPGVRTYVCACMCARVFSCVEDARLHMVCADFTCGDPSADPVACANTQRVRQERPQGQILFFASFLTIPSIRKKIDDPRPADFGAPQRVVGASVSEFTPSSWAALATSRPNPHNRRRSCRNRRSLRRQARGAEIRVQPHRPTAISTHTTTVSIPTISRVRRA